MRPRNSPLSLIFLGAMLVSLSAGGCFNNTPSQANIELRKQNQQLQDQLSVLDRRHSADQATIRGLQANATTVPVLPQDELDQLFTTAGLKFGSLTGGYHPDPNQYGDTMVKVYVCPIDQDGNKITATGMFHVDLFDLALTSNNRIGTWDFDLKQSRASWFNSLLMENYVLDCPWQTVPAHASLMLHVQFTDQLTHRIFTVDKGINIEPPSK